MKTLARIVARPTADGRGDVIIGVLFKDQSPDLFKPGHVYELREVLGEIVLVDLGVSALGDDITVAPATHPTGIGVNWHWSIGDILSCTGGQFILTQAEVQQQQQQRSDL